MSACAGALITTPWPLLPETAKDEPYKPKFATGDLVNIVSNGKAAIVTAYSANTSMYKVENLETGEEHTAPFLEHEIRASSAGKEAEGDKPVCPECSWLNGSHHPDCPSFVSPIDEKDPEPDLDNETCARCGWENGKHNEHCPERDRKKYVDIIKVAIMQVPEEAEAAVNAVGYKARAKGEAGQFPELRDRMFQILKAMGIEELIKWSAELDKF